MYTWGTGTSGQIGQGEVGNVDLPHKIDIKKQKGHFLACGSNHTIVVGDNQVCQTLTVSSPFGLFAKNRPSCALKTRIGW